MTRTQAASCTLVLLTCLAPSVHAQVQVDELNAPGPVLSGNFGGSLDLDGDRLIVGGNDDHAYLYRRDVEGWALEAQLASPAPGTSDGFGGRVALDGEWAAVGARFASGAAWSAGAVHVYRREGEQWSLYQTLVASAPKPGDRFGQDLALDAGRLIVGAPGDPDGGEEAGNAYAFEFLGFGWLQLAELAVPPSAFARYGGSVAVEGDWAAVGATGDSQVLPAAGAAHLWRRTPTGWVHADTLRADDAEPLQSFGSALSISAGRVAVGAPKDSKLGSLSGAVYLHTLAPEGATFEAKLTARPDSLFGKSVTLVGDELWSGATHSDAPFNQAGAVVLHRRGPEGWSQVRELWSSNPAEFDFFGSSLAVEGSRLLVAGPLHDTTVQDAGTVFEFDLASFAVAYCACAESSPCANADPASGCANSSGAGARVGWSGSSSTVADDLVLDVTGAPAEVFGLVCAGRLRAQLALGDGLLCLDPAGGLRRFPVQVSDAGGTFVYGPGLVGLSSSWSGEAIAPGTSWNLQCWFRDPSGPCGSGSNLSDAVNVAFSL